jgi:hypothetical protein
MSQGRPWVKYLALGCGGVIVLLVGFVAAVFFAVGRLTAAPEQVTRDFLAATTRGDLAAAHAHFSAPLKDEQPLAELQAAAAATPSFYRVADISFSERSIDTSKATLKGTARLQAGTEVPVSFTLVREQDTWRLLAYHLGADD